MGIPNFFKFCDELLMPQTSVEYLRKISESKPLNVYIDLPIFMFSGCIMENRRHICNSVVTATYDERLVAQTAFRILNLNILDIFNKFHINKIVCYIDGIRPNMKIYTSTYRKSISNSVFNTQLGLKYLCELINNNLREVELRNLIIGESEHEAFTRRDINYPTLILTDDSDVFHISYKYTPQSDHDLVFIGNKYIRTLYDMTNIDFGMPRLAFLTLLMLKGSDFTEKIFTHSMVLAIAKVWMKSNVNTKLRLDISSRYKKINQISQMYANRELEVQCRNTSSNLEPLTLNTINYEKILIKEDDEQSFGSSVTFKSSSDDEVLDKISVVTSNSTTELFDKSSKYVVMKKFNKKRVIKRISNIYDYSSVKEIVKLFLEILILLKRKNTHITFRWNASNNRHPNNDCRYNFSNNTTTSLLHAITWGVNYSSIGAFYKYYDDSSYYKYTILNTPFNFYASMLKADNSIMRDSAMTLSTFNYRFVQI